jgi:tellurite methyltransferase
VFPSTPRCRVGATTGARRNAPRHPRRQCAILARAPRGVATVGTIHQAVKRKIISFRQDEASDWVATLECGHDQHTRHAPPLSERPWVLSEGGRRSRLGTELSCSRCDQHELPAGYVAYRRTAEFTESTVPQALLSRHTTKAGIWAQIHVLEGSLRYRLLEPFNEEQLLEPGSVALVPPGVEHDVRPVGAVRFFVEFYRLGSSNPAA